MVEKGFLNVCWIGSPFVILGLEEFYGIMPHMDRGKEMEKNECSNLWLLYKYFGIFDTTGVLRSSTFLILLFCINYFSYCFYSKISLL